MDSGAMSDHTKLSTSPQQNEAVAAWPEGAIPEHWIESLFKKMAFTYGIKFADQWRGIDADGIKRHWAEKLGALSNDELRNGVLKLETRDWPPTLPEFIKLCRPVVDPVVAFHEALEQGGRRERGEPDEWSAPALFWAWSRIGAYDFAHLTYAALEARWKAALTREMEKESPEPIPKQMIALPEPGKTLLATERAQQLLANFKAKGMGDAAASGDGRAWARKILERKKRGEPMAIALWELAEQALGVR